jgi:hypothetical protein
METKSTARDASIIYAKFWAQRIQHALAAGVSVGEAEMTPTEGKSWFSASLTLAGDVGRHDCGVTVPSPVTAPYYPERSALGPATQVTTNWFPRLFSLSFFICWRIS